MTGLYLGLGLVIIATPEGLSILGIGSMSILGLGPIQILGA